MAGLARPAWTSPCVLGWVTIFTGASRGELPVWSGLPSPHRRILISSAIAGGTIAASAALRRGQRAVERVNPPK
jgi:hypothetical protein